MPLPEDDTPLGRELEALRREVRALTARIESLEGGAAAEPDAADADAADVADVAEEERGESPPMAEPGEPAPPVKSPPTLSVPEPEPEAEPEPHAGPEPAASSPRPGGRGAGLSNLEWLVGTRGIVLLGVVILVIAAGLFLKEAWERGWIATIPDSVRCTFGALFGLALVVTGEVLRRRISPLASAGVSAAGIAIVFGSILAAAQLYELIPVPVAFALLAATSLGGVALGSIAQRVLLAALSLVGAFLVPVVLAPEERSVFVMPAYLLALLALGLLLSGWRGPAYAIIRRIAWWGTAGLGTLWVLGTHDLSPASTLMFIGLVWAMTTGELVASVRFFARLRPGRSWPDDGWHGVTIATGGEGDGDDRPWIRFDLNPLFTPDARWLLTSFGATAWAVLGAGFVVVEAAPRLDWLVPAAFGLASAAVAWTIKPAPLRAWVHAATPRSALASVLGFQAVLLGVLTIAVGLGGALQVTAWAAVGVAAVLFGVRACFPAANWFGLTMIAVAIGRLMSLDLSQAFGVAGPEAPILLEAFGILITTWSLQVLMVTAAAATAAWVQPGKDLRPLTATVAVGIGAAFFIGPRSEPLSVGAAWALVGCLLAGLGVRTDRRDVRVLAASLAAAGMVIAATDQANAFDRLRFGVDPTGGWPLAVHWTDASWAMAVIAAAWVAMGAWPGRRPAVRAASALLALIAAGAAVAGGGTPATTCFLAWAGLAAAVGIGGAAAPPPSRRGAGSWRLTHVSVLAAVGLAAGWSLWRGASDWGGLDAVPLLHAPFVSALLIAGTLALGARRLGAFEASAASRDPGLQHAGDGNEVTDVPALRALGWIACGGLLLLATSSEVVRGTRIVVPGDTAAQGAALSVWWSLFAAGLIWLGIAGGERLVRWPGLILFGVTAAKVLAVDLGTLTPMWRIAGSAIVGLVLLAAGIAYAWLLRAERDEPDEPDDDDPGPDGAGD